MENSRRCLVWSVKTGDSKKKQTEKTRPLPHWTASIQALEGIPVVAKVLGKTT